MRRIRDISLVRVLLGLLLLCEMVGFYEYPSADKCVVHLKELEKGGYEALYERGLRACVLHGVVEIGRCDGHDTQGIREKGVEGIVQKHSKAEWTE